MIEEIKCPLCNNVLVNINDVKKITNDLENIRISARSEHFGGIGHPPDRILQLKPNALVTYGMGPRALTIFQNARIAVLRTRVNTVRAVITAYNNNELEELTEGCHQAQHH